MLDRIKRTLVESYIGAIALGYAFAQSVLHFAAIFTSPIAAWVSRKQYAALAPGRAAEGFALDSALPELVRFCLLLLTGLFLLRWLYFVPVKEGPSERATNADQTA